MSKLLSSFRMTVPAGKATPQPPVGSALGQRGLNLMNFCKAFNDQTSQYITGTPMQARREWADNRAGLRLAVLRSLFAGGARRCMP